MPPLGGFFVGARKMRTDKRFDKSSGAIWTAVGIAQRRGQEPEVNPEAKPLTKMPPLGGFFVGARKMRTDKRFDKSSGAIWTADC